MLITRKRRINAEIDMTPLIDVVFQLLIFLMVSSQFIKPDQRVELPTGPIESAVVDQEDPVLTLVIDSENQLFLEGVETSEEQLGNRLRDAIKHTDITTLAIRSDESASVGTFLPVIEIAREAGMLNIAYDKKHEPKD